MKDKIFFLIFFFNNQLKKKSYFEKKNRSVSIENLLWGYFFSYFLVFDNMVIKMD